MQGVSLKRAVKGALRSVGLDIVRYPPVKPPPSFPLDFTEEEIALCTKVKPFTLGGDIAVQMTAAAVEYIVKSGIPGAIVECGVWRGGMMMAAADTLLRLGDTSRDIFLCDTCRTPPTPMRTFGADGPLRLQMRVGKSARSRWSHLSKTLRARSLAWDIPRIEFTSSKVALKTQFPEEPLNEFPSFDLIRASISRRATNSFIFILVCRPEASFTSMTTACGKDRAGQRTNTRTTIISISSSSELAVMARA
jgi:hypothetical protein